MTPAVEAEVRGRIGFVTLNRPQALNALSLDMVRGLYAQLLAWRDDPAIVAIAMRGTSRNGPFGAFCAGGDIRFFHEHTLRGNPQVEDFFTEEYLLDALIQHYPKPCIACMDGITMGGGMGLAQGTRHRIVTERSQLAMPETRIGLFPDVGGGYFLSRCPGHAGEWLALTGNTVVGADALAIGWADHYLPSERLPDLWRQLGDIPFADTATLAQWLQEQCPPAPKPSDDFAHALQQAGRYFADGDATAIVQKLEAATDDAWAQATASTLRQRSPLMLHVVLQQVRSGRALTVAENIHRERSMVRHCFYPQHLGRTSMQSEVLEGVRALVIDKDQQPRWQPQRVEEVTPAMVDGFFVQAWPDAVHPLAVLKHGEPYLITQRERF
ncbi:MAG: enoyl-CoA hydratase/isomerase family protein [Brachymonas sp.]|nr:enoyl-CoA hydratase/isomerase family protein [Brachymonas sp.]